MIYRWKAYEISKLFYFGSFPKLYTFLKLFQKLIFRFSRLFVFSESIFVAVFISFIGMMHMIYSWIPKEIVKLIHFKYFSKNSGWYKSNFRYGKQLFNGFFIFGHYFAWHFQTVYPIDTNDMALETYRLGATFSCWSFLRISYHLRAILNIGDLDF
jgi:hypothetical protein